MTVKFCIYNNDFERKTRILNLNLDCFFLPYFPTKNVFQWPSSSSESISNINVIIILLGNSVLH